MTTSIGERVSRSLNRATVIQRVCQGQMCTAIGDLHVDEGALNCGLLSLITEIVEDLVAIEKAAPAEVMNWEPRDDEDDRPSLADRHESPNGIGLVPANDEGA